MIRWKTIRQRRWRSRRGQVSAVATIFGLLLVVTFIANFVILQLPAEEAQIELQHLLIVENQLARLQATLAMQADQVAKPLILTTPVTLGSQADPPLGPASSGSLSQVNDGINTTLTFRTAKIVFTPPDFGIIPTCPNGGVCGGHGFVWDNFSGENNTNLQFKITGTQSSFFNLSVSNDTIEVDLAGHNPGTTIIVVNGSYNTVWVNKTGSLTNNPTLFVFMYGIHDTFNIFKTGGGSGVWTAFVQFVAQRLNSTLCPDGNATETDTVGTVALDSNTLMTVNWWNSNGWATAPHTQNFGSIILTWQNKTGFTNCAFNTVYFSIHGQPYFSGIDVHLNNRYIPAGDLAFDQGAVILSQSGGTPIMIDKPQWSVGSNENGETLAMTYYNFLGTPGTESGLSTVGVETRVLDVQHYIFTPGLSGTVFVGEPIINLTTYFPSAWNTYFGSLPPGTFVGNVSCTSAATIHAPFTCLNPPPNTPVSLSTVLAVGTFSVTIIAVQVAFV